MSRRILKWALMLALVTTGVPAVAAPPQAGATSFVGLVNRVSPAVVNIDVIRRTRRRIPGWPDEGSLDGASGVQRGVGSGFLVEASGLIVTNSHVVQGQPELMVTLWNGRTYTGKVLGNDPLTDLALVKIDARGVPTVPLGNSDTAHVGEWVLALGSPLGLRRTVTAGIISSTNREVAVNERMAFLQTDAAINPGNSGGPLVNMAGQVIGINTAIAAEAQGIGFAIPVNALKLVLNDLKTRGHVVRAWLGVSFAGITPELAERFPELKGQKGVIIAQVVPGSPAEEAGLRTEDILTAVDGKAITSARDLVEAMARRKPGEKVRLTYRRGGKQATATLTLGTMPASAAQPLAEP